MANDPAQISMTNLRFKEGELFEIWKDRITKRLESLVIKSGKFNVPEKDESIEMLIAHGYFETAAKFCSNGSLNQISDGVFLGIKLPTIRRDNELVADGSGFLDAGDVELLFDKNYRDAEEVSLRLENSLNDPCVIEMIAKKNRILFFDGAKPDVGRVNVPLRQLVEHGHHLDDGWLQAYARYEDMEAIKEMHVDTKGKIKNEIELAKESNQRSMARTTALEAKKEKEFQERYADQALRRKLLINLQMTDRGLREDLQKYKYRPSQIKASHVFGGYDLAIVEWLQSGDDDEKGLQDELALSSWLEQARHANLMDTSAQQGHASETPLTGKTQSICVANNVSKDMPIQTATSEAMTPAAILSQSARPASGLAPITVLASATHASLHHLASLALGSEEAVNFCNAIAQVERILLTEDGVIFSGKGLLEEDQPLALEYHEIKGELFSYSGAGNFFCTYLNGNVIKRLILKKLKAEVEETDFNGSLWNEYLKKILIHTCTVLSVSLPTLTLVTALSDLRLRCDAAGLLSKKTGIEKPSIQFWVSVGNETSTTISLALKRPIPNISYALKVGLNMSYI